MIDLLLSPFAAAAIGTAGVWALLMLTAGQKKLSPGQKQVLMLVLIFCLLYGFFILWLSIGFGAPPPVAPQAAPGL